MRPKKLVPLVKVSEKALFLYFLVKLNCIKLHQSWNLATECLKGITIYNNFLCVFYPEVFLKSAVYFLNILGESN